MSSIIPLGQPILVKHHSGGRHRRDIAPHRSEHVRGRRNCAFLYFTGRT
ncbi:MAG: DUF3560 domain-containing protein [Deltaproteobacteria bacterium]|nr:DUF3560 domain-containing protein [Deltaproteobacteria bacterium]